MGPRAGLDEYGRSPPPPAGIPFHRPVRSELLHRLSYPSPPVLICTLFYLTTVASDSLSARLTYKNSTRNGHRVCELKENKSAASSSTTASKHIVLTAIHD